MSKQPTGWRAVLIPPIGWVSERHSSLFLGKYSARSGYLLRIFILRICRRQGIQTLPISRFSNESNPNIRTVTPDQENYQDKWKTFFSETWIDSMCECDRFQSLAHCWQRLLLQEIFEYEKIRNRLLEYTSAQFNTG